MFIISLTILPNDASNIDDLLKITDESMYSAKKGGRNKVVST
jgi:PleD family two-component response regulator